MFGGYALTLLKVVPAIIVSNDLSNRVLSRFQVVPVSSQIRKIYPGETLITLNGVTRKAMADQITTVSERRLTDKLATLSLEDLMAVEAATGIQLDLDLVKEEE